MDGTMPDDTNNRDINSRLDKHDLLFEKLTEGQTRLILVVETQSKRLDQHDADFKEMRKEQVDTGKILEAMKFKFSIGQWLLGAGGLLGLAYLFSHLFPK